MHAPAPTNERSIAKVLMIIATMLYTLSLLPWLAVLLASMLVADDAANMSLAYVMTGGALGWPVAIIVGLVIGWRGLRYRSTIIGGLLPLIYGLVVVLLAVLVRPEFWGF